jgi:hypothetical protein
MSGSSPAPGFRTEHLGWGVAVRKGAVRGSGRLIIAHRFVGGIAGVV